VAEAHVDLDRFWELVEAAAVAGDGRCHAQAEQLTAMLEQLAPEEIVSFERHFTQRMAEAYRWDLWGLAYQLNGGCSDDCFVYFRCWLLAQGRATWEATLADPDSLMDHPVALRSGQTLDCEPMLYVTINAYYTRAEAELPDDSHIPEPAEPFGEQWDFQDDEEVRLRLPRTWARLT
jgi:Protein of unknown function (DUF4240)